MRWIESGGGPLILVPEVHLVDWHGVIRRPLREASDYDLACEVLDEVGVIRVASADVLVLGDEPLRTAWLPHPRGGFFVQWIYADREESIVESLSVQRILDSVCDAGVRFSAPGACVLFDSAEPGTDIRGDRLQVLLQPGTYAVKSGTVSPSGDVRVRIHQVVLVS